MVEHGRLPPSVSRSGATLLDFGGGDGCLMRPLIAAGHRCSVLDYEPRTQPGIERIGATLDDLRGYRRFDAIVCSYVIEHVSDPVGILSRLREHLNKNGTILVEVPLEVWRRPPLQVEPLTHVNFFAERSAEVLLARCGFVGISTRLVMYDNVPGHTVIAIVALGTRRGNAAFPCGPTVWPTPRGRC